ncbi:MAG TPA: STAS domain-containing protein [Conexibacter sp.]|nr:STAS domain-containing protein [Conexibacter sp.]
MFACAPGGGLVRFAAIVEYVEHPPTLRCCGDEDRSTQARRRQALVRAMKAHTDIVADLAELSWADVSLMLDFVTLARRLRVQGLELVLRHPQPQIAALLELVGLDRVPSVRIEHAEPVYA